MNSNCLQGFECPDCGSEGPFRIEVSAMAVVYDDGVDEVEGVEWEDTSTCWCLACMSAGEVKTFRADEDGKGETTTIRFCEFTGDDKHVWDEVGHKRACPHIGIMGNCLRYHKPLGEHEGWRVCVPECDIPVQVKEVQS